MRWKIRLDTENVFLITGLGIVLLGWIADYIGVVVLAEAPSGHGGGSIVTRLFFTLFGLTFAAGGVVYDHYERFLQDPVYAKRYLIQAFFILDGALHLFAFNDHINESLVEAIFFAIVGPMQIAFGIMVTRLPPKYDPYLLAWPVFLIVLAAVSLVVPIWPLSAVEGVYDLWFVSKIVEVLTVLLLLSLMKQDGTLTWAAFKRAALGVAGR